MQDRLKKPLLQQINEVFKYEGLQRSSAKYPDLSDLPTWEFEKIKTMALAATYRIAGEDSIYARQAIDAAKIKDLTGYTSYKTVAGHSRLLARRTR